MVRSTALRQAIVFTSMVYVIAILIALALPHSGLTPLLSLFAPVLSVVVLTFAATPKCDRGAIWRDMGLRRAGTGSWPAAVGFPIFFLSVAYGAAVVLGVATLRVGHLSLSEVVRSAPNFVLFTLVGPIIILGEEVGWRGYLLPRLQTLLPRPKAALVTGLIHGAFHLPAILLTTTYDSVGNRLIVAPVVVATITFAGIFYGWLRDRSGTIWPVAIAHNTANMVFSLGASAAVTASPAALAYTAGESGIATLLAVAGVGIWLFRKADVWHNTVRNNNSPSARPTGPRTAGAGSGSSRNRSLSLQDR